MFTMAFAVTQKALVILLVFTTLTFAATNRWDAKLDWCLGGKHGGELYLGDFNGDGRTDLLCHRAKDGYKWIAFANEYGRFDGTSWQYDLGWCKHHGAELHIGDFNGDGRSDMLCHDTKNGDKWIAYANHKGNFEGCDTWDFKMGWCYHSKSQLLIGDFNGDGRDDLLCHDSTGYKWIALANSHGNFKGVTSWKRDMGWCYHKGAQLFIGDFNGDGSDDMLCHDTEGKKWIAYSNGKWFFEKGTGWRADLGWCNHHGASLHIADTNGDGRDDMICHDTKTGKKWVAQANSEGNFCGRTTWEKDLKWCRHSSAQFFLGDFNGDRYADMLCHNTGTGGKWIIYANAPTPVYW